MSDFGPLFVQYVVGVTPTCHHVVLFGLFMGLGLPLTAWIPWLVSRGNVGVGGLCATNWDAFISDRRGGIQWLGGFNETYYPASEFNGLLFQNLQCIEDTLTVLMVTMGFFCILFAAWRTAWAVDLRAPRGHLRNILEF